MLGVPLAIGMTVGVLAALTLSAAIITVASRFGNLLEPEARPEGPGLAKDRGCGCPVARSIWWRRSLSLIGLLTLPGYRTNYNDRNYLPADLPANVGYAAADRHFCSTTHEPRAADDRE